MKRIATAALVSAGVFLAPPTFARDITVEITNLTNAIYFTPLLVAAHPADAGFFDAGAPASHALQAMAEGGDLSGLLDEVQAAGGVAAVDPAGGVLPPGATTGTTIDLHGRRTRNLSVVAMLLPTNDGFLGLNSVPIPRREGRYTFLVTGYDAGTEANDEIVNGGGAPGVPGIPADPGGNAGVGGTGAAGPDHNPTVHVHRGILGDAQPVGGPSDLNRAVHRWGNPVARVVVTVGRR